MSNDNIFTIAFKLHTLGFSVIPSGGGESGKAPLVNWTEFQRRKPTDLPPPYPLTPCPKCGSLDYWLRDGSPLTGPAEWLCPNCHPKPGSKDNAE